MFYNALPTYLIAQRLSVICQRRDHSMFDGPLFVIFSGMEGDGRIGRGGPGVTHWSCWTHDSQSCPSGLRTP